jgi:hypothetical protein
LAFLTGTFKVICRTLGIIGLVVANSGTILTTAVFLARGHISGSLPTVTRIVGGSGVTLAGFTSTVVKAAVSVGYGTAVTISYGGADRFTIVWVAVAVLAGRVGSLPIGTTIARSTLAFLTGTFKGICRTRSVIGLVVAGSGAVVAAAVCLARGHISGSLPIGTRIVGGSGVTLAGFTSTVVKAANSVGYATAVTISYGGADRFTIVWVAVAVLAGRGGSLPVFAQITGSKSGRGGVGLTDAGNLDAIRLAGNTAGAILAGAYSGPTDNVTIDEC